MFRYAVQLHPNWQLIQQFSHLVPYSLFQLDQLFVVSPANYKLYLDHFVIPVTKWLSPQQAIDSYFFLGQAGPLYG